MAMVICLGRSWMCHQFGKRVVGSLETLRKVQSLSQNPITEAAAGYCRSFSNLMALCSVKHFLSIRAGENVSPDKYEEPNNQALDFPGGKVNFASELRFLPESPSERVNCYRVLNYDGKTISGSRFQEVTKEIAIRMYSDMVTLQTMDTFFYEAQRQGRISFYVTSNGEEAINIASAAALTSDDIVFPQYREPGVLLWRGFTLQEFANQNFGNKSDYGKGRQMPIHYGCNRLNYFTVSSPIATQLPQAVGAAYSLKMDEKDACTITYFGDGGTSEGDFHAAFVGVMDLKESQT